VAAALHSPAYISAATSSNLPHTPFRHLLPARLRVSRRRATLFSATRPRCANWRAMRGWRYSRACYRWRADATATAFSPSRCAFTYPASTWHREQQTPAGRAKTWFGVSALSSALCIFALHYAYLYSNGWPAQAGAATSAARATASSLYVPPISIATRHFSLLYPHLTPPAALYLTPTLLFVLTCNSPFFSILPRGSTCRRGHGWRFCYVTRMCSERVAWLAGRHARVSTKH